MYIGFVMLSPVMWSFKALVWPYSSYKLCKWLCSSAKVTQNHIMLL